MRSPATNCWRCSSSHPTPPRGEPEITAVLYGDAVKLCLHDAMRRQGQRHHDNRKRQPHHNALGIDCGPVQALASFTLRSEHRPGTADHHDATMRRACEPAGKLARPRTPPRDDGPHRRRASLSRPGGHARQARLSAVRASSRRNTPIRGSRRPQARCRARIPSTARCARRPARSRCARAARRSAHRTRHSCHRATAARRR